MNAVVPIREGEDARNDRAHLVNYEAEQALLAALLADNRAYDHVAGFLRGAHFADAVHGRIFDAAAALIDRGEIANAITLKNAFERDNALQDVGGDQYLRDLQNVGVASVNAQHYGRTIHDLAVRRDLAALGDSAIERALRTDDVETSATDEVEAVERELYHMAAAPAGAGAVTATSAATQWIDRVEAAARAREQGQVAGITTGLTDLDRRLGGLHGGSLVVVAGRPGMGKTALALSIAQAAAKRHADGRGDGAPAGVWSLEMDADELTGRLLAEITGISVERQQYGASPEEIERLVGAQQELPRHLYIEPAAGLTTAALRARARRMQRQKGLGLIVVDYIQLMRASRSAERKSSTVAEVSEITRDLKQIAKELNVPVVALSQLSRAVEQRENKRPQLSDLRESGTIEQDADRIVFCFREEYYLRRDEPQQRGDEDEIAFDKRYAKYLSRLNAVAGTAELIIPKNRQGQVGTVRAAWNGERTAFYDLAEQDRLDGV